MRSLTGNKSLPLEEVLAFQQDFRNIQNPLALPHEMLFSCDLFSVIFTLFSSLLLPKKLCTKRGEMASSLLCNVLRRPEGLGKF